MVWCSRCFCCSLQQGAVIVALYAVSTYTACLGVTIWWLSSAGSGVIPAFILAPIYFIILIAALTLLISLMFQTNVGTSVALFLTTLGLLMMPEAALNVYTCITNLGIQTQMGLGLLIFFILRGICNIISIIHLYSYYQTIRHGTVKPSLNQNGHQNNQMVPMTNMMPGVQFQLEPPARPARVKNLKQKQQQKQQQNTIAPIMMLTPLALPAPQGPPFQHDSGSGLIPSSSFQASRSNSDLPNVIYSPSANVVLERNRGAPVSHGNVVQYTPAPLVETDDSVSNIGGPEPTIEMAPSESGVSSRPGSNVGAALISYRRPRIYPSPQRPLAFLPSPYLLPADLQRNGSQHFGPMTMFPQAPPYSIPVPPNRSRWVMNGKIAANGLVSSNSQDSMTLVSTNGVAIHHGHPLFIPAPMPQLQFAGFPPQPMLFGASRSMPNIHQPLKGEQRFPATYLNPNFQPVYSPANEQVLLAPPPRRMRTPNGVTLQPFQSYMHPETMYAGTSRAPSMIHLSANPIGRSKSNVSDSVLMMNNRYNVPAMSNGYVPRGTPPLTHHHRPSQFDTSVPVPLLNGENPVPLGATFDVDDSDTEAGFEKLLTMKMRTKGHEQQRIRQKRQHRHQSLLATVEEHDGFIANDKVKQASPSFSTQSANKYIDSKNSNIVHHDAPSGGESRSGGDSGDNRHSSPMENENENVEIDDDDDGLNSPITNYILTQQIQNNLYEKQNKNRGNNIVVDAQIRNLQSKAFSDHQILANSGLEPFTGPNESLVDSGPLILGIPKQQQSPRISPNVHSVDNAGLGRGLLQKDLSKELDKHSRNHLDEKLMLQHPQAHSFHENGDDARLIYYQQKAANSSSGVDSSFD